MLTTAVFGISSSSDKVIHFPEWLKRLSALVRVKERIPKKKAALFTACSAMSVKFQDWKKIIRSPISSYKDVHLIALQVCYRKYEQWTRSMGVIDACLEWKTNLYFHIHFHNLRLNKIPRGCICILVWETLPNNISSKCLSRSSIFSY